MDWARVLTAKNCERLLVGDLLSTGAPGGLLLTLILAALAIVIATLLATPIALARQSQRPLLWLPAAAYIEAFRNVPLLILVFWAYFVPPVLGYDISAFTSLLVALSLFTAAYIAETLRSGILTLSRGQIEAARTLGMSAAGICRWIVLPQAYHRMLPALAGRYIITVKNTSLAFLIGLADLTEIGKQISARLMTAPVEIYLVLMAAYFVVNRAISAAAGRLEDRAAFGRLATRL